MERMKRSKDDALKTGLHLQYMQTRNTVTKKNNNCPTVTSIGRKTKTDIEDLL